MVLTPISDFPQAEICSLDSLPGSGWCAVMTKDRCREEVLIQLDERLNHQIIVQEIWKEILPQAPIMISSAICGGNIKDRFCEASATRSCWLLLEPIRSKFPLPCHNAVGEYCPDIPNAPHFYSESLSCFYAHSPKEMVLWDTSETLYQKMLAAKEAGFLGYVYENKNTAVK